MPAVRRLAMLLLAACMLLLLGWAVLGLPSFGASRPSAGTALNHVAVPQRKATDVVTSVVFDYRGVDTMGEEFIFFAAVSGVALLLRPTRTERKGPPSGGLSSGTPPVGESVERAGLWAVLPILLIGLSIVAHGHLTPGGGFQGGTVIASASITIWLAAGFRRFRRANPLRVVDAAEGVGAGLYPVIGGIGLVAGSVFLANVLPLGSPGSLLSAGTMPILNLAVGLEVSAGFVLMAIEFLEQAEQIREPS